MSGPITQFFLGKATGNTDKKQVKMNKQDIRYKQHSNVRILVWLRKTKYWYNTKLCYSDTDSVIVQVKSEDIYQDLVGMLSKDSTQTTKLKDHCSWEETKKWVD